VKQRVIDADAHLNSPPDLYQSRVSAKHKERAPKVVRLKTEAGECDAWVVEGGEPKPMTILAAAAGKTAQDLAKRVIRFEEMLPGAYDAKARLVAMSEDGIDSQALFGDGAMGVQEPELRTACVRAYNDWLSEFCRTAPERLLGLGVIPVHDPAEAVREVERTATMGLRGLFVGHDGVEFPLSDPVYDRMWAAAAEQGRPVNIHIGGGALAKRGTLNQKSPPPGQLEAFVSLAPMAVAESIATLIFGGVLERHPTLKVIIAEGGIGWVAYFLERMDHVFHKQGKWARSTLKEKPSFYFRRQMLATFEEDLAGMRTYDLIGTANIMWSSDYPHSDTTWPHSRQAIEEHFGALVESERQAMICGNAQRVYGL
jgi:predicted TIM-barrel fold metal-dependent hydrolase